MKAIASAALAAALMVSAPSRAEGLEIIVSPYFLLPTSDGKFAVGPLDTNISSSPADLFRDLNWAILGSVEVNNGEWGLNFDVNYVNLNLGENDPRQLSVDGHQAAYTAIVLKRVHPQAWVYAGARLNDFGVRLHCETNCAVGVAPLSLAAGNGVEASRNKSWVEPLVGFRAELPFSDSIDLTFMADVGGFGLGSKIAVNVWPQLGFSLGRTTKAMLGYRIIYVDYESGADQTRFVYDAVTYGPTIGFEFRF